MNKNTSLIRLGDETLFENPWGTFLTEIIFTSSGWLSFLPLLFSLILAWRSPLHRNVAANTVESLSTWLFSKVIRHVRPGKLALPTCQVRSVDDIFKSGLQLHTTKELGGKNSRHLRWTFAAIYWCMMGEQHMLLHFFKWSWENWKSGDGGKHSFY